MSFKQFIANRSHIPEQTQAIVHKPETPLRRSRDSDLLKYVIRTTQ